MYVTAYVHTYIHTYMHWMLWCEYAEVMYEIREINGCTCVYTYASVCTQAHTTQSLVKEAMGEKRLCYTDRRAHSFPSITHRPSYVGVSSGRCSHFPVCGPALLPQCGGVSLKDLDPLACLNGTEDGCCMVGHLMVIFPCCY